MSSKRYSKTNPAPRRCATCALCDVKKEECTAPTPAWVSVALEDGASNLGPYVDLTDYRDPKCPLWQARGPTAH